MDKWKFAHILLLTPLVFLFWLQLTLAGQPITIERTLFFPTPEGESIVIVPGTYTVSAGEGMLYLDPGKEVEKIGLPAEATTHTDTLTSPEVISFSGKDGDSQYVTYFFPDGKALTAVGSRTYGAVRSLGLPAAENETEGKAKTKDPTITIPQPISFATPEGKMVVAEGIYTVQAGEDALLLNPEEGTALTIKAEPLRHEDEIEGPTALVTTDQDGGADHLTVALFLPEGQGWEAMGSGSGVQSRGFSTSIQAALAEAQAETTGSSYAEAVKNELLAPKGIECGRKWLDRDGDCINEIKEPALIKQFAPEVRLHPQEWAYPANVDWFLPKVNMWFHHGSGCADKKMISQGSVTQLRLSQQKERDKNHKLAGCDYKLPWYYSNKDPYFYLHRTNDSTKNGSRDPKNWIAYAHAIPVTKQEKTGQTIKFGGSTIPQYRQVFTGAIDIQYWFFFPYNDSPVNKINHEGDWEGMSVRLNSKGEITSAQLFAHGAPTKVFASKLRFVPGTQHPIVYAAKGSHATYRNAGSHKISWKGFNFYDRTAEGGLKWQTWTNVLNVGERDKNNSLDRINSNQSFILFSGNWGEMGSWVMRELIGTDVTTGPVGPAFKPPKWCPNGVTEGDGVYCRKFGTNYAP